MVLSTLKRGLFIVGITAVIIFFGGFLLEMCGLWGVAAATTFTLAFVSLLHVLTTLRTKVFEPQTTMFIDMTVIFFIGGMSMAVAPLSMYAFVAFILLLGYYIFQRPEILVDPIF